MKIQSAGCLSPVQLRHFWKQAKGYKQISKKVRKLNTKHIQQPILNKASIFCSGTLCEDHYRRMGSHVYHSSCKGRSELVY